MLRFLLFLSFLSSAAMAQTPRQMTDGLQLSAETHASVSDGTTPLWLNANRYGLSSLEEKNAYLRLAAVRPAEADSSRQWRWGYGVDVAVAANHTSTLILQQAYAELRWKRLGLTFGAKQQPVPLSNQRLSSGALTFGCNARPIPQLRMDVDWFAFPGSNGWWKWKANGSFGMTTDGGWQKSFANSASHYTSNILYHEKALYWKFGKEDHRALPLTYELGLQMVAQFGGESFNVSGRDIGKWVNVKHPVNLMAFVHALTASGSDENDGSSKNTAGNHLGSWIMRLTWHGEDWKVAARLERFFEDQSMMFLQYGFYDHLVGLDVTLPRNRFVSSFTIEHLSTYDQSGAILHDAAPNIPDKMNGRDNYYNHNIYPGHHHWGQTIGTPLLTSPIYNKDGFLEFSNNRVKAIHLAAEGNPLSWLAWRAMATFTRNWGTYDRPLHDIANQQYYMVEATVAPPSMPMWRMKAAVGLDRGPLVGNNFGAEITIRRTIEL